MHSKIDALIHGNIHYRGPLSYRGLRLLALFVMTISQISVICLFMNQCSIVLDLSVFSKESLTFFNIGSFLGQISFPLLLIASFGIVLSGEERALKTLITYLVLAVLTYLATVLILYNFIIIIINIVPDILQDLVNNMKSSETVSNTISTILERILNQVIPGDGVIHLDNLNRILTELGVQVQLPTMSEIQSYLQGTGLSEMIQPIIDSIASLSPDQILSGIFGTVEEFTEKLPTLITSQAQNTLVPYLTNHIVSRLNFNMFWDLFLYTTFFYFTCSHPKNLKAGRLLLFRCGAALPAAWMIISAFISGNIRMTSNQLPAWFIATLSSRNLAALLVFFLMVLFVKFADVEYVDKHSNTEGWQEYLQSKNCSLQFSVYSSIVLLFVSLVDFLLGKIPGMNNWGVGESYYMWVAIPILLLYSFNRRPKHKILDAVVPVYYVIHYVIILVFLFYCFILLFEKMGLDFTVFAEAILGVK